MSIAQPITGGLIGPHMKIARAEAHLNEIEREHQRLIDSGTYTISKKDNRQKLRHIIRIESKATPRELALLVGEFAYSLRSALDQLAWQLALLKTGAKRPRRRTSFPVWSKLDEGRFGEVTRDILPAAVAVIDSLQPYKRGTAFRDDPLWILNELCITDKHVILPISYTTGRFRISGVSDWTRRDFQHAVEISIPLAEKFKVQLDPEESEIVLGEPFGSLGSSGFEVRITKLRSIYDFVGDSVIPRFTGFFK